MEQRPSHERLLREKYKQEARERKESFVIAGYISSLLIDLVVSVLIAMKINETDSIWIAIGAGIFVFVSLFIALTYLFRWIEKKWILDAR